MVDETEQDIADTLFYDGDYFIITVFDKGHTPDQGEIADAISSYIDGSDRYADNPEDMTCASLMKIEVVQEYCTQMAGYVVKERNETPLA